MWIIREVYFTASISSSEIMFNLRLYLMFEHWEWGKLCDNWIYMILSIKCRNCNWYLLGTKAHLFIYLLVCINSFFPFISKKVRNSGMLFGNMWYVTRANGIRFTFFGLFYYVNDFGLFIWHEFRWRKQTFKVDSLIFTRCGHFVHSLFLFSFILLYFLRLMKLFNTLPNKIRKQRQSKCWKNEI